MTCCNLLGSLTTAVSPLSVFQMLSLGIKEVSNSLRNNVVKPKELYEECLKRAALVNRLNAFISLSKGFVHIENGMFKQFFHKL